MQGDSTADDLASLLPSENVIIASIDNLWTPATPATTIKQGHTGNKHNKKNNDNDNDNARTTITNSFL